ncbi:MAG: response regulator [Bacillota bacterium]|nr:response regulator [Bacillota bacterium]
MIFEEFLSDVGYHILTAYDGDEGLIKLNSESPPDLVMVDLKMPGTSGKMVIHKLRQNPLLYELPVIIVTGSEKNDVDFPPEGTYQDIIYKPFRLEEVLAKIKELI